MCTIDIMVYSLGAGIVVSPNITSILKQCEIYDEFLTISNVMPGLHMANENRESEFFIRIAKGRFDR